MVNSYVSDELHSGPRCNTVLNNINLINTSPKPPTKPNKLLKSSDDSQTKQFNNVIRRLKWRIGSQAKQIDKLQTRLLRLTSVINAEFSQISIDGAMKEFISLMRKYDIDLEPRTVLLAFSKKSETLEDLQCVFGKTKTLSRTRAMIKKKLRDKVRRFYIANHNNMNKIFKRKADILAAEPHLAIVLNTNILKYHSNKLIFYHMPLKAELADYKVKVAHFDGKFSGCPKSFKQTVELRLVLYKNGQEVIITFARALMKGFRIPDYEEFFLRVKKAHCKHIPIIVTDYEIAISKAVNKIYPKMVVRGCWYHYWNNLLCNSGKLKRFTRQLPIRRYISLLSIMPFLYHPEIFIILLLNRLESQNDPDRFKDVNVKLILYVVSIYLKRFRDMFFIDLSKCTVRTNNSCEGSNSGLSRFSSRRLEPHEYTDYVEFTFKKDLLKQPKPTRPLREIDHTLLKIQRTSKHNADALFDLLINAEEMDVKMFKGLNDKLDSLIAKSNKVTKSRSDECWAHINHELYLYNSFKAEKRRKYLTYRNNHKEQKTVVEEELSGVDFNNILDIFGDDDCHSIKSRFVDDNITVQDSELFKFYKNCMKSSKAWKRTGSIKQLTKNIIINKVVNNPLENIQLLLGEYMEQKC